VALRDLFGRQARLGSTAPGPEAVPPVPAALAPALADLERLCAARPELAGAGRVLGRVLLAAFRGESLDAEPAPHANADLIVAAWRSGVPAFRAGDSPPRLDPDDLRARAVAVCEALGGENPRAGALRDAVLARLVDLHAWAVAALGGCTNVVSEGAEALGLDDALARSVLRLALLPPLARHSAGLAGLRTEGLWARGDCPNCGGPPTLAESRGLEQRRFWRCGVCAADWPGDRLRCPFCGETDHRRLRYRFVEGEQDRERLALCDTCGEGLPVVSTLAPLSTPGLLVAELATAHLESPPGPDPREGGQ
jgi:hypothetical protein